MTKTHTHELSEVVVPNKELLSEIKEIVAQDAFLYSENPNTDITENLVGQPKADPKMLPAATGQTLSTPGYLASLAGGANTTDPLTGVTIIKLTANDTPQHEGFNNVRCSNHHAQVCSVSLPWGASGEMRTVSIAVRSRNIANANPFTRPYLLDVDTVALTTSNYRSMDTLWEGSNSFAAIAFSPISPRIVYTTGDDKIAKFDTSTDAFLTEGNFPKTIADVGRGSILFVTPDEGMFVITAYNRLWFKFWETGPNTVHCATSARVGQGGMTPAGTWGWETEDDPNVHMKFRVTVDGCTTFTPSPEFRYSHPAGVDRFCVGGFASGGFVRMHAYDMSDNTQFDLGADGDPVGGSRHMFGNWTIDQPDPPWIGISTFTSFAKMVKCIGYIEVKPNPVDARILCHTDSEGVDFNTDQPHASCSPDGKVVVWQSSMNNAGGRSDVFMALVPTS